MGGGARCFRSISPGDFLGLTPLCFQLGLGVILHARGIGWSCRLRRALGSVQKKKIDFHFHFLADWWLSLIIPPLLRSLCVDIGCGYLAVKVGEWDEFQHCHLLKRLTAEGVVVLFFFSKLGRGWFEHSTFPGLSPKISVATLNCSYHFFISTFVSVDAAPLRTNRFLTVVSCCNLTTLNIEGEEVTGEGSKEITTMVSNSNAFRFILIDFS